MLQPADTPYCTSMKSGIRPTDNMQGVIIKAVSSFYYVDTCENIIECKARGNFRKAGISPVVGDRVNITLSDSSHGVIESIKERKNCLSRPLIANIDKLFIVSAYSVPKPDTLMIDRIAAISEYNKIEPVIVFNKSDMGDFEKLYTVYRNAGFETYVVSAKTGEGIESIKKSAKGKICAFAGNSGVGKSSILNCVFGDLSLKTNEVSEKLGRGRHTTRHTQLFKQKDGGYIADTPGFSSLDTSCYNYDFKEKLPYCFRDFEEFLNGCKFTTCSHTKESGCKILEAVNSGKIEKTRFESYVALVNELKEITAWGNK